MCMVTEMLSARVHPSRRIPMNKQGFGWLRKAARQGFQFAVSQSAQRYSIIAKQRPSKHPS